MKIFKLPLAGLLFCTAPLLAGCGTSDKPEAPVSLTWEMGTGNAEPGYYENSFVLKNISGAPLPRNWTIYYSQLPRNVKQVGNPAVKVEPVNGTSLRCIRRKALLRWLPAIPCVSLFCVLTR